MRRFRKLAIVGAILAAIAAAVLWFNARNVGVAIDSYKGVPIYDNGPLVYKSHGRNYSPSGYYYGQKWAMR